MIQRRHFLAAAGAVLAPPSLSLAQTQAQIVGTLFPMSGGNAEFGAIYTNAVQLALEHIAADKMLRSPIELRTQDSQATPQGGAIGMTRLATVDKAPYVLLGFTGVSKAAAPIGDRNKVLMVNGGGVGPDLATLSPYFINIIPLANKELAALLPWLSKEGLKRIAVVYVDDPLGQSIHKELDAGLPKNGGTLAGAFSVPPTQQQFAAVAARVRDAKPDAVYFATPIGTQLSQMMKQLRDNGITQPFVTYSVGNIPSVTAQPESEGLVFTGQAADWTSTEPKIRRFVEGWRAKYNTEPVTYGLNYYNATMLFAILAQALEAAGKPVDGENLRTELMRVRTFQLAGGEVAFDEQGSASSAIQLSRIRGGKAEKIA